MRISLRICAVAAAAVLPFAVASAESEAIHPYCRCLPGDDCWPSLEKWDAFNKTVGGRLVATVPIGAVCHDPWFDEAKCEALKNRWSEPDVHYTSSSSVMEHYWANNTCTPFSPRTSPCTLGNLVSYAVNLTASDSSSAACDIAAALSFARTHNIRFLTRNTGHDFFGRSTGAGALAVWTHHLKNIEVLPDYSTADGSYTGPAIRMGSGIQGFEAQAFAAQHQLVVVGGWCPSVGLAGGFTQGGGHSPLGSVFGMGADQTLEFEVVTVSGELVIASPSQNTDLYWALSGGGPGTYGIVVSVVVRAFPDLPVGGATVFVDASSTTKENYWQTIREFYKLFPALADAGVGATFSYNNSFALLLPVTAYNSTGQAVKDAISPWTQAMDQLGVFYQAKYTDSPGYNVHWTTYVPPGPVGGFWQSGGRILPRTRFDNVDQFDELMDVVETLAGEGVFAGVTLIAPIKRHAIDNAVLPAWRTGLAHYVMLKEWSEAPADWERMLAQQTEMSSELSPLLKGVTRDADGNGGGAYMNEADFRDPEWQQSFFGDNYERLRNVKRKWDPKGVLWGLEMVGSDDWTVGEDGRMCRMI